jgi:hypothetical protein
VESIFLRAPGGQTPCQLWYASEVTSLRSEGLEIREDLPPVLFITLRGRPRPDEWLEIFHAFSRFYARGERFCSVVDTSTITTMPDASSRNTIARLAKEHESQSRRWVIESNVVVNSALARGVLTAIHWVAPPVYPISYVATCREATTRAFDALARENRPVPEAARAFAARLALVDTRTHVDR